MNRPFQEGAILEFEGDDGKKINVDGQEYDRVELVMIEGLPIWIMSEIRDDMYYPVRVTRYELVDNIINP